MTGIDQQPTHHSQDALNVANGAADGIDPITGTPSRPGGAGMYLHWEGRRSYRTRMPAPRVLEPVSELSFGEDQGNRIIEGDNLQVMVSLRSHYRGMIDIAYLDPPYNRGKRDFRYSDRRYKDPNADSDDATYVSNEDGGRHTKWLNYIGPRLYLTWELLADHGVCFVSIDNNELFRLGMLMDEIFGEKNRIAVLVWKQQVDNNPTRVAVEHEYILCYAKRIESVDEQWHGTSQAKQWMLDKFLELKATESDPAKLEPKWQAMLRAQRRAFRDARAAGREEDEVDIGRMDRFRFVNEHGPWAKEWHLENPRAGGYDYDIPHNVTKKACRKPPNGYRYSPQSMDRLLAEDRIVFGKDHTETAQLRRYLIDAKDALRSVLTVPGRKGADRLAALLPSATDLFPHPKPVELIEILVAAAGDFDALVLDPFAGSGTTADAVLRLNKQDGGMRRFILIEEGEPKDRFCRTLTVPRVIAAIEKDDLKAGFEFETTGRRLDRQAILELEREAITNLIVQTDPSGVGKGIQKVPGSYVIGTNARREAICLCWNGRASSTVTSEVLTAMFVEAKEFELRTPLRVYGSTCEVAETESFRFCQIPDAILAALQIAEQEAEEADSKGFTEAIEIVETHVLHATREAAQSVRPIASTLVDQ